MDSSESPTWSVLSVQCEGLHGSYDGDDGWCREVDLHVSDTGVGRGLGCCPFVLPTSGFDRHNEGRN